MRASSFVLLTFGLVIATTPGCGDDDPNPSDGPSAGGTSSTGGAAGSGGNAGVLETGLPGGLGDRCDSTSDCLEGLTCLAADADEDSLLVGTPPAGLCTIECAGPLDCLRFDRAATCVEFGETAYCVQSCEFGTQPAEENKCYLRPELSCQPLSVSTGVSCTDDADCRGDVTLVDAYGEAVPLCFEGECSLLSACLPRCNSDFDCPEGRFCDPATGECASEMITGQGVGETCDPDATDECRGICIELPDGSGECEENCTVGAQGGCGFADASEAPVRCEFFTFDFGREMGGQDEGSCATLCDCNADCPGEQHCFAFDDVPTAGLCLGVGEAENSLSECPASGSGGAGGLGGAGGANN